MKTLQELKSQLTENEFQMLDEIVGWYDFDCNLCFTKKLTSSEKGTIGSLVKKGLVYDSFEDEMGEGYESSNFFPSDAVLDIYNMRHY